MSDCLESTFRPSAVLVFGVVLVIRISETVLIEFFVFVTFIAAIFPRAQAARDQDPYALRSPRDSDPILERSVDVAERPQRHVRIP